MSRFGGHRIPDEYNPNWEDSGMPEYYLWWHLGYEDGVSHTKWDYGIPDKTVEIPYEETLSYQIEKLEKENRALRSLIGANVRVMKEELRKEMEEEAQNAPHSQLEAHT